MYTMRCSLLVSESKWFTLAFVLYYRNSSRFSHRAQATPPNVSIASITLDGSGFECTHLTVIDSDMTCPRVTPPVVFQNQWVPFRCHVCPYATPVGLLVRLWSTHASWACDIHLMPWCLPGWASLVDKLEVIVHFFYHLPHGFLSHRNEEPLPELSPKTPVSGYYWPRRTQVADKLALHLVQVFPAVLSILVVSTLSLFVSIGCLWIMQCVPPIHVLPSW